MAKKNKIPKNRSINEMLGKKEEINKEEEKLTMEDVIAAIDKKEQDKKQERK